MEDDCRLAVQATEANAAGTNHSRAIVPMRQGGDVPNVKAVERAKRRRREAWREAWAPALFEWSQRRGMWVLKPETVDAGEPRGSGPPEERG